jgi:hypothetical protein
MPQRDRYHEVVKAALIADGWIVTHDPYYITLGERRGFVDLGAEQPIAAEQRGRKIAVEIKSFTGPSPVADLEAALGQYLLYRSWMARVDPDRILYLAIDSVTEQDIFADMAAQVLVSDYTLKLVVINIPTGRIAAWKE